MPAMQSVSWPTPLMIAAPLAGCPFMTSNSSSLSAPGLRRMRSSMPILPTSCSSALMRRLRISFSGQMQVLADGDRVTRHAFGVAARVRVLRVDRRGEHADRVDEEQVVLVRRLLQLVDRGLDRLRHHVEVFGQVADLVVRLQRRRAAGTCPARSRACARRGCGSDARSPTRRRSPR